MPKMSGLPQVMQAQQAFNMFYKAVKDEGGSSEDDGIDEDDEINLMSKNGSSHAVLS